jgi:hypothetical protein
VNETVAAVLATIGVMGTGMGLVFRALLASSAKSIEILIDQNRDLRGQLQDALDRNDRLLNIGEGQTEVTKEVLKRPPMRTR